MNTPDTDQLLAKVQHLADTQPPERPAGTGLLADLEYVPGSTVEERRARTWEANVPSRFHAAQLADLADTQPAEVTERLTDWAERPAARNLVLLGAVGVGKTHAAVAACRAAHFARGYDVAFLPVVELLDMLRPGGPEHALPDLVGVDLLIVDDLGMERPTEWTAERMYALLNRRWLEQRPTVATTNLGPPELQAALGERLFSRVVGSDAVVLGLGGDDRRRRRG